MSKNKAVIFLNGDKSSFSRIRSHIDKDTLLIGCDGGTDHMARLGFTPKAVIGDFDSIKDFPAARRGVKYVRYPRDKDYTDSELAIRYAHESGCREIILAGLLGTRTDHLLGNIFLLSKDEFKDSGLKIIEGDQEIYPIHESTTIKGKKGEIISFIPLNGDVQALGSTGLRYDLGEYKLSLQGNKGISNELTSDTAVITLQEGSLLVVHTLS